MFENDFALFGKHATYLKFLVKKNAKDDDGIDNPKAARIFERYIDVYMNAAVFGLLYNKTAEPLKWSDGIDRARIYADAFATERDNCIFLYRLVLLLDQTTDLEPEERINRAFRYDSQPGKEEEFKHCMRLFNSYVCGGIEVLYEQFTEGCATTDDYLSRIYEVMTTFKNEINGISYEEELEKIVK